MQTETVVLLLMAVLVFLVLYFRFYFTRARFLLEKWANEHHYTLLKAEHRMFRKGPFFFSGRSQAVFRVEIRDEYGTKRWGWVRCGSWFRGVFADVVEGRLDDNSGNTDDTPAYHLDYR